MGIHMHIDTENLTALDWQIISALGNIANGPSFGNTEVDDTPAPAKKAAPAAKKAAAPAKKAAAKPAPEPEPEEEEDEDEDLIGSEDETEEAPTAEDCIARAGEYVANKKAAQVKKVLTDLGASKVSELDEDNYADFLAALPAL